MIDFIKKNIFIIVVFLITLFIGFITFLTFIDKSFLKLSDDNLQLLLIGNIALLILLFFMIFSEVRNSLKIDVDVSGSKANRKYITFFALFTLIPSILISLFSLFLLSYALDKYLDKKITTAVNNSYEIAKSYTEEVRTKTQSEIILIAFDLNKSINFLNTNINQFKSFLKTPNFALLNEKYSAVFDNLGGDVISICLKYLIKKGILVSIGNILGNTSNINILPLILREVSILSLNAEFSITNERKNILQKILWLGIEEQDEKIINQ